MLRIGICCFNLLPNMVGLTHIRFPAKASRAMSHAFAASSLRYLPVDFLSPDTHDIVAYS